jgi:uncharacterized protein (DUF433 family)
MANPEYMNRLKRAANSNKSGNDVTIGKEDVNKTNSSVEIVPSSSELVIKNNPNNLQTKEIITVNIDTKTTVKHLIKKRRDNNKAQEILDLFPNMTVNQIVNHFIAAIEDARLKETQAAYNLSAKTKRFKDSRDTFSIPVRPEMKQLLDIIDYFYPINKYKLYEILLIEMLKAHDFDKDLLPNDDD